jgi:hypothetical protein
VEDRDLTDAAEILACARAQGVAVSLNGDRIVLEGYRPRPTWLVSVVSESKAEIVAELRRTVGGGWPWLFEERVSHVMRLRNLPRVEAERVAYEMVLVEFLNRNCADTPSDRCAWCGKPETRDSILLPIGVGARHSWLHNCCWAEWREGRRAEAIAMLAGMGITEPSS